MTGELLRFGGGEYCLMLALLLLARGMDFFSTWVATPSLLLEGNPLARRLGWKMGGVVNIVLCLVFALWPLTAIIISTAALLVAAHNFHAAWLMRSMGEEAYRDWFIDQMSRTRMPLFMGCLLGETVLTGLIGAALVWFSPEDSVAFAIGVGVLAYAGIVLVYTSLSLWRMRRLLQ